MSRQKLTPDDWIAEHGSFLYRYALYRVSRPQIAEDLVSETFVGALRSQDRFEGRSSERTWLMKILKNKISDYYRRKNRLRTFTDIGFDHNSDHDRLSGGNWKFGEGPAEWNPSPSDDLEKRELLAALGECIEKLPLRVAEIFRLRELQDVSTEEVCQQYDITPNNVWVIMHRARLALRSCLEENYFNQAT